MYQQKSKIKSQWNIPIFCDKYLFKSSQISTRRRILSVIFFIIIGLLLSLLVISFLGIRTQNFFLIFTNLFNNQLATQNFLYQIAIYTVAGLAFSFAMNVGIFNIGISGQMLAGASTAVLIINAIPWGLQQNDVAYGGQLLTIFLSIIGAVSVALFTGLLKIYLKVNEVVSAILLNWIILLIVGYLVFNFDLNASAFNEGKFQSNPLPNGFGFYLTRTTSASGNSFIYDSGWLISIIVAVICVFLVWFLMKFTVFGHKLKTTGLSSTSAKYFGYNEKSLQLASFAISGALAGILGAIVYTGSSSYLNFNSSGNLALNATPPEGFNGIAIGLIALNNPIGIAIVSVLFSFINVGAGPAQLPTSTVSLVTGIMMYIIAIYQLSTYIKPWRWIYLYKYGKINSENYLNFENYMGSNVEKYYFSIAKVKNEIVNKKVYGDSFLTNELANTSKGKTLIKWYYKTFAILSIKDQTNNKGSIYKVAKQEIKKEYYERRKEIINEFRYACAYSLIINIEQKLNNNQNVMLTEWKKDQTKIKQWTNNNLNSDILVQLAKHNNSIDSKIKLKALHELINLWEQKLLKPINKSILTDWKKDYEKMNGYLLAIDDIHNKEELIKKIDEIKTKINSKTKIDKIGGV